MSKMMINIEIDDRVIPLSFKDAKAVYKFLGEIFSVNDDPLPGLKSPINPINPINPIQPPWNPPIMPYTLQDSGKRTVEFSSECPTTSYLNVPDDCVSLFRAWASGAKNKRVKRVK